MRSEIIVINNLSFRYHKTSPYVLKDISLSVRKGEWLSILGHNGSGKSTLAKFLNALHIPVEGEVIACGMNTKDFENLFEIRRQVTMVFQNPDNQMVAPTVEDDVAFGLENAGIPYGEMVERVNTSIHRLGLTGLEKQEPHRLSGGQKQRVALAGALALRPKVIILDEATSMLDPIGKREVWSIVKQLREDGITFITVTHDVNEAMYADRMIVLKDGEIIQDGLPQNLLTNETLLQDSQLKAPFIVQVANELRGQDVPIPKYVLTHEELVNEICKYK